MLLFQLICKKNLNVKKSILFGFYQCIYLTYRKYFFTYNYSWILIHCVYFCTNHENKRACAEFCVLNDLSQLCIILYLTKTRIVAVCACKTPEYIHISLDDTSSWIICINLKNIKHTVNFIIYENAYMWTLL